MELEFNGRALEFDSHPLISVRLAGLCHLWAVNFRIQKNRKRNLYIFLSANFLTNEVRLIRVIAAFYLYFCVPFCVCACLCVCVASCISMGGWGFVVGFCTLLRSLRFLNEMNSYLQAALFCRQAGGDSSRISAAMKRLFLWQATV